MFKRNAFLRMLGKARCFDDVLIMAQVIRDETGHKIREKALVKKAFSFIEKEKDKLDLAVKLAHSMRLITGHHLVVQTYAEKYGVNSSQELTTLLNEILEEKYGRLEAWQAIQMASQRVKMPENLGALCEFAKQVRYIDGSSSEWLEDLVINTLFSLNQELDHVVHVASCFKQDTGTNRTLLAWVQKIGVKTEGEAKKILKAIQAGVGADELCKAVIESSQKYGLTIDLKKLEMVMAIESWNDKKDCQCIGCQILSQNIPLEQKVEQMLEFQRFIVYLKNMRLQPMDLLAAMESFGVSPELKEILAKDYLKKQAEHAAKKKLGIETMRFNLLIAERGVSNVDEALQALEEFNPSPEFRELATQQLMDTRRRALLTVLDNLPELLSGVSEVNVFEIPEGMGFFGPGRRPKTSQ